MNEMLIFTAGVSLGALVVCFSVCAAIAISGGRGLSVHRFATHPTSEGKVENGEEELTEEQDKMKRQFENFLNYDGTTNGQSAIGDE